ncbi:hypothetical protein C8Q77DRAFT_1218360 [Trametes polyzona]|nr:hypothetical protein C8Q77DRAFT_1218360 [Trametes polyzona]
MEALTRHREKHEQTGFIETKNGELMRIVIAALRARKAQTAFKWVKGHNGHPRNEGADRLAGEGAETEQETHLNLQIPDHLNVTGAQLLHTTQKLAYRAIRRRKSEAVEERAGTKANLETIMGDLEDICNFQVKQKTIWTAIRKRDVTRECRQFIWKAIHDGFMVGRHWLRPSMSDTLRERATCKICLELDSLDHILFRCKCNERTVVTSLLEKLWSKTKTQWPGLLWGTTMGAPCVRFETSDGERLLTKERLWTILATETSYLIWKLRCERVIQREGASLTATEIENRWYATIDRRLSIDRRATAPFLEKRALDPATVEATWYCVLENVDELPPNWVGDSGVLVGIRRS